jgi:hypothetical protein
MPCRGRAAEQLDQRDLGAVQLPVAREAAAVLVAVAVAEHDVLLAAGALHHRGDARQRVEVAHDRCGVAQVADGLEQRHDDQVGLGMSSSVAAQQPRFLQQQQHLQQVAHVFGVRDDVVAQCLAAVALQHHERGLEDRDLALRVLAVGGRAYAQRARVVQQAQQQLAPLRFGQRAVVGPRSAPPSAARRSPPRACRSSAQVDVAKVKPNTCTARISGSARPASAWACCDGARFRSTLQVAPEVGRLRSTASCGATAWRSRLGAR